MHINKLMRTQNYIWRVCTGQKVSANITEREHTKTGIKGNEVWTLIWYHQSLLQTVDNLSFYNHFPGGAAMAQHSSGSLAFPTFLPLLAPCSCTTVPISPPNMLIAIIVLQIRILNLVGRKRKIIMIPL